MANARENKCMKMCYQFPRTWTLHVQGKHKIQNKSLKIAKKKFQPLFNDDESVKPKANNQVTISDIIALHEQQFPTT